MKNTKQLAFYFAIVIVAVVFTVGVVKATTQQDFFETVADKVAMLIAGDIMDVPEPATVGASGDTNLTNLVLSGDLTVGDVITSAGARVEGSIATLATTSALVLQLTAANVCDNTLINSAPNVASSSVYMPTNTTLFADCLSENGATKNFTFRNTDTGTAEHAYTITASTTIGQILLEPTGGDVVIQSGEWADIEITRISSATSSVKVTSLQNAD